MAETTDPGWRYFTRYTGFKLPLSLVGEIPPEAMGNRNTYVRTRFDASGRLTLCEKVVYDEVELRHVYRCRDDGRLEQADISCLDEDPQILDIFD